MNKTKRKIFETSMKLFAQKGYDATSIEEITATVGVAKGTLYYYVIKNDDFEKAVQVIMTIIENEKRIEDDMKK